jgi:transcriptional regulator with XRE-family HTH domain
MRALRRSAPAGDDTTPERDLSYSIAQAVHDLRTGQGLSQEELARKVGTKQPRISVVESARGLPSIPLLLRIARALGRKLVIRFEKTGEEE